MAEPFIQAGRYAWFGVYPTLGEVKAVPSTEPKAVLEHRAPKTSPPILHSKSVESKVGRVPHVRDAPPSVHPETSGGQGTARPTNPVVTERAPLGRSKFCIEEQGFVRAGCCVRSGYTKLWLTRKSCQSIEPKAVLEHRAPKTFPPILHSRSVESKVGRAVHCAPVWVVQTWLLGQESLPSAPLRARLRLTAETLRRRVR